MIAFRFIQGIGTGGEVPVASAYINEYISAKRRGRFFLLSLSPARSAGESSETDDTMVIFDKKGKFVRSWGKEFKGGADYPLFRYERLIDDWRALHGPTP